MRTFLANFHGRDKLDQGDRFCTYILLIIELKGMVMKFKNVPHTISVEWLILWFFYVSQLSYKPSIFAQANKPYAMG